MEPDNNRVNEGLKDYDEFNNYIDSYSKSLGIPDLSLDPFVEEAFIMSHEDFLLLTSEEAASYAFKLTQYILFLRKDLDKNRVRSEWCSDVINRILAKTYSSYSEYMKYEVRKQSIMLDNSYALKVHELKMKIDASITIVQNKIEDVQRLSDIFRDASRRKGFAER